MRPNNQDSAPHDLWAWRRFRACPARRTLARGYSVEGRKLPPGNVHLDRPSAVGRSTNETSPFESQDHLVNRRRGDLEVPLNVGLGRRPSVHLGVRRDEREVLPLELSESTLQEISPSSRNQAAISRHSHAPRVSEAGIAGSRRVNTKFQQVELGG